MSRRGYETWGGWCGRLVVHALPCTSPGSRASVPCSMCTVAVTARMPQLDNEAWWWRCVCVGGWGSSEPPVALDGLSLSLSSVSRPARMCARLTRSHGRTQAAGGAGPEPFFSLFLSLVSRLSSLLSPLSSLLSPLTLSSLLQAAGGAESKHLVQQRPPPHRAGTRPGKRVGWGVRGAGG